MNTYTLGAIVVAAIAVVGLIMAIVARYKRCPSDKILVVYGKTGKNKEGGIQTAKCIHGGATFIWPVVQSFEWLDLTPITIETNLDKALSKQNIRVNVPANFTVGISTEPDIMNNAAERLLGLSQQRIEEMAHDIIVGQMRLVIATMDIEEINNNRDVFLKHIQDNLENELEKIGLKLINVNITDITDESNYIEALGQEAAAKVTNEAKKSVAERDKFGSIGEAEAQKEQRVRVAEANTAAEIGEKNAEAQRRRKVEEANANATEGENEAKVRIAQSDSKREIAESEAQKDATIAQNVNAAKSREESYEAERIAEVKRAEKEEASQKADKIVPAKIQKEQIEIQAEADAEKIRRVAQGEADAIKAKKIAEAEGIKAILEGQAAGLEKIVKAAGGDADKAMGLMVIDKLPEIIGIQAEAIKNIDFDKIVVWDNGGSGDGSGSTSNFINNLLTGTLPMSDEIYQMVGKKLPNVIDVRKDEKEQGKIEKVEEETSTSSQEEDSSSE